MKKILIRVLEVWGCPTYLDLLFLQTMDLELYSKKNPIKKYLILVTHEFFENQKKRKIRKSKNKFRFTIVFLRGVSIH